MELNIVHYSFLLLAYLLGSVSSAVLVCQVFDLDDPRKSGSKNPGSTNVLRIGGKKAAIITLLMDALKGYGAILLAQYWLADKQFLVFIGIAVVTGHILPIFFRFAGGKGVATAFGVLIALHTSLAGMMLLIWVISAWLTRFASVASLVTAVSLPLIAWLLPIENALYLAVISLMITYRHKTNIINLIKGQEHRITVRTT